jgi:D-alanyl-D-alanine carboxypeptidase
LPQQLKSKFMKQIIISLSFLLIIPKVMSQNSTLNDKLQNVLDKSFDQKNIFGTSFAIKQDTFYWNGSAGNLKATDSYFIASTTKLFTSAIIFHLKDEGKLSLEDKINKYLDNKTLKGLHVFKGKDYSNEITIKQLLAHTSGLPDYFQNKGQNGLSLEDELIQGKDQFWTFDQAIEKSKAMTPIFAPGTKNKAHYSDANFQLLAKIIENITQKSYSQNCKELIIDKLNLSKTYLYSDSTDLTPKSMYYQNKVLEIPKAMTSFGPDGGMVSTNADLLVFIEAFFEGKLFSKENLEDMQSWNKIFFPMRAGVGIHQFKLPWIFNPTGFIPVFIGHSGLSGALAYYSPREKLFIVGTVNQIAHPDLSFKTMIKLTQILLKEKR